MASDPVVARRRPPTSALARLTKSGQANRSARLERTARQTLLCLLLDLLGCCRGSRGSWSQGHVRASAAGRLISSPLPWRECGSTAARGPAANMQYASAGFGSPSHLACALLNSTLGVEVRHLPYRGGSLATRELLAGKVDYSCSNVAAIKPHIEAGRLIAPAVLSSARLPSLPSVATAQEQGVKDFEASNWMALFLPSATPEPIVARLNAAAIAALADPTLQTKLRALGAEPASPDRNTPERLAVFLAAEREKWGAIIRKAHIRLE